MTFLFGEIATAPLLMAAALGVAFVGSIGIGFYVVRHTPDSFTSAQDAAAAGTPEAQHAA